MRKFYHQPFKIYREMSQNYLINIDDIETSPAKKLQVDFEEFIEGIHSEEPIRASLELSALGEFIEITGHVEGIAILECDLCLEKFEYDIDFDIEEMFVKNALSEAYGAETELKEGQFVTDLKGSKDIDIYDLLYQSVILDFPNKKVCGINCKGGDIFIRDENHVENETDPRLAVFKNIKVNK